MFNFFFFFFFLLVLFSFSFASSSFFLGPLPRLGFLKCVREREAFRALLLYMDKCHMLESHKDTRSNKRG